MFSGTHIELTAYVCKKDSTSGNLIDSCILPHILYSIPYYQNGNRTEQILEKEGNKWIIHSILSERMSFEWLVEWISDAQVRRKRRGVL
jgi:hypothetical protein